MREIINRQAAVESRQVNKQFEYETQTMLTLEITYPVVMLEHDFGAGEHINSYYRYQADSFYHYSSVTLFHNAVDEYRRAGQAGYPFRPYDATMHDTLTMNDDCHLSTYFDRYTFTGGAHGNTVRLSDNWNLQTGCYLELPMLFCGAPHYRRLLLERMLKIARQKNKEQPGLLFEDYPTRMAGYFNPQNFYFQPGALCIYYQQYEIGPYSSGIIVFELPFSSLGMRFQRPRCRY